MSVGYNHKGAVSYAVSNNHAAPQRLGIKVWVVWFAANGGWVHQNLGTAQRVVAGNLGEPFIPAGRQPNSGQRSTKFNVVNRVRLWGSGTRCKVLVFVVTGGHRNVQFWRAGYDLAGWVNHDCHV